MLSSRSHSIF